MCSPPTHKHTQGKHKPELGILQAFQRTGMVQNVILVFFRRRLSQRPAVEELERRNILKREYFLLKIFYIFAETAITFVKHILFKDILIYWDYFLYLKVFMFSMLWVSNVAEMRIYTLLRACNLVQKRGTCLNSSVEIIYIVNTLLWVSERGAASRCHTVQ